MTKNVLDYENDLGNLHSKIKELCKEARNRLGMSNQDIADAISERFEIEDFSLNTVNNFFSERSKATTIYTTGYICSVLNISIDDIFGIEHAFSDSDKKELTDRISKLEIDNVLKTQRIEHLEKACYEKDLRINQAHKGLDYYRAESGFNMKKVQPWGLYVAISAFFLSMVVNILLILFR